MSQEDYDAAEIDRKKVFANELKAIDVAYAQSLNDLNTKRGADIAKAIDKSNLKADQNGAILENEAIPVAQP